MIRCRMLGYRGTTSLFFLTVALCNLGSVHAKIPNMLKFFSPRTVGADPKEDYQLTETEGPWMILAASFSGDRAKERAKKLVLELRRDYNLPSFYHRKSFKPSLPNTGRRPIDRALYYASPNEVRAYTVLVGEFDSINHPKLIKTLEIVKQARPQSFSAKHEKSSNNRIHIIQRLRELKQKKKKKNVGPMRAAFATRNPVLPNDFAIARQVEPFVASLNQGVEFSLLDNPGKYTVVVRTFSGATAIQNGRSEKRFNPSGKYLNKIAHQAHKIVTLLRKDGIKAWEFHDRHRSLVTIGSFDKLGSQRADGSFEYAPEIIATVNKYKSKVVGIDPQQRMIRAVEIVRKPVLVGNFPLDTTPHPIAVPVKRKRAFFTAVNLGKRR